MSCCDYSCTQYSLHTQYMLQTHADDLLCLQLHTVQSPYTVHASNPCWCLAVPTAVHSRVSIHSTCFKPMLMTCCAYSCTQYSLHTQYMLLTHADDLLCLQLHTVVSIHSTCFKPMLMPCSAYSCTQNSLHRQYSYMLLTHVDALLCYSCTQNSLHTQYMLQTHFDVLLCLQLHTVQSPYTVHASYPCWCLAVPTAAHSTVSIHSTCFIPMLMPCCAYSCTLYSLHTQYMLHTHVDVLLCLQLHTVQSPYTVHASYPCWCLAVPTAAHSTVSIYSTSFILTLMTCCTYSCSQYSLHKQYMLQTHADALLCLQLHTVQSPYTVHASNPCWCPAVPTAAHSTVSKYSKWFKPMLITCCAYSCTQYGLRFFLTFKIFILPIRAEV